MPISIEVVSDNHDLLIMAYTMHLLPWHTRSLWKNPRSYYTNSKNPGRNFKFSRGNSLWKHTL